MAGVQPSDTIWVGNLPPDQTEETLKVLFEAYGAVVRARPLGDSKGHGAAIIQLSSVDEAGWIVENLNGNIAHGLKEPINVRFVNPKGGPAATKGSYGKSNGGGKGGMQSGGPYGGGGSWGGGASAGGEGSMSAVVLRLATSGGLPNASKENLTQIYVAGLPPDSTDLDLYMLFSPFGCPIRVGGATVMLKPDGTCTGTGFIDVMEPTTANAAIQALNGLQLPNGNRLRVQLKRQ
eukprot:CAMPEP_0168413438 /NCGR_PEP_ID=MMETSP0228-20121227/29221_1 /TAXON_ID=133427 /ORGANISM="Protoceratium reticulatum, Strain CCCM 535 (=CCMP 1889)" /LENGTH=234 /DNA_ID=CAMNT_0008427225 /DNA_START=51 /DNA_END=755 /DNA_ORIENTATION=-